MGHATETLVVGVRFSKVGKIYHFAADMVTDIKVGDMVVVETSRGWQLGQVAQIVQNAEPPAEGWKPIDRRATPRDLLLRQMWQMKEAEVVSNCRDKASALNLMGIKIVSAEYSFDGSRLTILFSSETEEKYDLKSLRQDMQKMFAPSQVEMRQVGPRDVAKVVCGMGACGLETRCCCLFLTEFSSISIRMAKEQGISLTPTEITGMCGRLRCCLIYEYDTYVEARSQLPKRNKRVRTPQGEGKVVDVVPLRSSVIVDLGEAGRREFTSAEIVLLDANGNPEPNQPVSIPPLAGTQQPSEMDKALTGDTEVKPFVISADTPAPESNWENPPKEEQPRSMPRQGGQQRRGGRDQQAGGRDQQAGGHEQQPGGREQQPGGRPFPGRRERGPQAGRDQQPGREPQPGREQPAGEQPAERGEQPKGERGPRREGRQQGPGRRGQPPARGPRRENRPQDQTGGQAGGQAQGQPGQNQPKTGDQQRPDRPRQDRPRRNPPRQGNPPQANQSNNEPGSGDTPRSGQDPRRRRGNRRDNNEPEDRT